VITGRKTDARGEFIFATLHDVPVVVNIEDRPDECCVDWFARALPQPRAVLGRAPTREEAIKRAFESAKRSALETAEGLDS
jgi:hypothetical protein